MTLEEAIAHLDSFYAWDTGAVDSGVKNDALRAEVAAVIDSATEGDVRVALARWYRAKYLSDEALMQGYGMEDAGQFGRWFYDGDYRR